MSRQTLPDTTSLSPSWRLFVRRPWRRRSFGRVFDLRVPQDFLPSHNHDGSRVRTCCPTHETPRFRLNPSFVGEGKESQGWSTQLRLFFVLLSPLTEEKLTTPTPGKGHRQVGKGSLGDRFLRKDTVLRFATETTPTMNTQEGSAPSPETNV